MGAVVGEKMLASFLMQLNMVKTTNPICPWNCCRDGVCVWSPPTVYPSVLEAALSERNWMHIFGSAARFALVVSAQLRTCESRSVAERVKIYACPCLVYFIIYRIRCEGHYATMLTAWMFAFFYFFGSWWRNRRNVWYVCWELMEAKWASVYLS